MNNDSFSNYFRLFVINIYIYEKILKVQYQHIRFYDF